MIGREEATKVVKLLDEHAQWKRNRTPAALTASVDHFIDLLPDAVDGWALEWLMSELRSGRVPPLIGFPKAWMAEKTKRLQPFRLSMPHVPDEVRSEGRAIYWERAYLAAVLAGADREGAYAAACAKLGVAVPGPALPSPPGTPSSWAEVRDLISTLNQKNAAACTAA